MEYKYIRADGEKVTLYYWSKGRTIKVPLSYSPIEVKIRYGAQYLGWLREGVIWCSKWWYKVERNSLIVVVQTEGG